jgi:FHS family glucose/mannose:H+ symporter-like MFS transporter
VAHLGLLIAGVYLFFALGAAQASYGPMFPQLQGAFGLGPAEAGTLASAHFLGGFLGILVWSLGERWRVTRPSLAASVILLGVGSLLLAMAPTFALARAAAAVLGIGYGSITLGLHRLFAVVYGLRAGAMLNLVNALFGAAAVVGPLAVGALAGSARPIVFGTLGVLSLLAVPLALTCPPMPAPTPAPVPVPSPSPSAPPSAPPGTGATSGRARRDPVNRWTVGGFMGLFLLYVSAETGVGAWEAAYLLTRGYSESAAASWSATFWAGLAVGRLLAVPVSLRLELRWMVVLCLSLAVLSLLATQIAGIEPAAFTLAGLAMAAVFPTSFAWLTRVFPAAGSIGGLAMGAAMLGGVVGPWVGGQMAARYGAGNVPWALATLELGCLGCALWLHQRLGRAPVQRASP